MTAINWKQHGKRPRIFPAPRCIRNSPDAIRAYRLGARKFVPANHPLDGLSPLFAHLFRGRSASRLLVGAPRPQRGPSPFVATRHFPRPAGESSLIPQGPSFSCGRKGCKRPFRGSLWTPPKDPRLILPISALYQVRASRPSLRRLVRADTARSSAARWACGPMLTRVDP